MTKSRPARSDDPIVRKFGTRFEGVSCGETFTFAEVSEIYGAYLKLGRRLLRVARISDNYQAEVKALVLELQDSMANVKALNGCIPICASCKKIRNDEGFWKHLEQYMAEHSEALFTHGLCPDCVSTYRMFSQGAAGDPPPAPHNPAHMLDETDLDDPGIIRFLPILNQRHFAASPLYGEFSSLFQRYLRLTKRVKRIARISDAFQSQLLKLKNQLELASRTDYLTGLPNRRDMYDRLEAEFGRSVRHGTRFAVVMADIDHFKRINDTWGHDIGDRVLVAVAELLRDNLRKEDYSARWGGEEFLLLLPETGGAQALEATEKLRGLIAARAVETGATPVPVTASFGVAVIRRGESLNTCIKRADDALLQAKDTGRNRCVLHQDDAGDAGP
jgi:diguanylate cyclase (GGDEF)-like protein